MKKRMFAWKVYLSLLIFTPLAFIPSSGRGALLSSQKSPASPSGGEMTLLARQLAQLGVNPAEIESRLGFISPAEARMIAGRQLPLCAGGQHQRTSPLSTNEAVAIVLCLLMLGCAIGFVEQNR